MISKGEVMRMLTFGARSSYNEPFKAEYKRLALKLLRAVAKELGCYGPGIVRFNPGGIAVSGDAILHSERVYIMILNSCMGGMTVLVRACESRKDYTGFANHYYPIPSLETDGAHGLAVFASKIASYHATGKYGQCKACERPIMREELQASPAQRVADACGLTRRDA